MFDFDSITFLIAVVSLIAFAIPFMIYSNEARKQSVQNAAKLESFLQSQHLQVAAKEIWRDRYFLGLDLNQEKLAYTKDIKNFEPTVIHLSEISHVSRQEVSRVIGTGKSQRKVIDALYLNLFTSSGILLVSIEIYDGEVFSDLSGEPVLLTKWEKLLKDQLAVTNKKENLHKAQSSEIV
ncbi:hypothetical protein [Mongoliitalea daihaiensis]|uniref:hypothetical protein n=1 Tax=Mongoliitalea daihaiensis TaxID=2782006 RepID=UPI001F1D96C6|nr:hypothetical protein [Mongoliitalea daihaiensis]UJP64240.1 hypothetical protein IPZ59_15705 [Mongoliitalea daihaiensis]